MKLLRTALSAVLAVTCLSLDASADVGLFLSWNDCPGSPSASSVRFSGCSTNTGQHPLYVAFEVATSVDSVLGVEIVVDLQTTAPAVSDWWRFDGNGCRYGSLLADGSFDAMTPCEDLWGALNPSGTVQSYTLGMPRGGANQARIRVALGIVSPDGMTVTPGSRYLAARLTIDQLKTVDTGLGDCPGCSEGVCLVLNSIILKRPPRPAGVPSADVLLVPPGHSSANWAIWQNGTTAQCSAVPVRPSTWGEIKSLYR